jgi:hypothetical protein
MSCSIEGNNTMQPGKQGQKTYASRLWLACEGDKAHYLLLADRLEWDDQGDTTYRDH